jgi:hypothetical protein
MNRGLVYALLFVLVLVSLLVWWIRDADSDRLAAVTVAGEASVTELGAGSALSREGRIDVATRATPSPAKTSPTCVLSVLRTDATPLAKAEVRRPSGEQLAVSNERGIAEVELDAAPMLVHVAAAGLVTRAVALVEGPSSVTLNESASLAVRVVWADTREPVVGASVVHERFDVHERPTSSIYAERMASTTDERGLALLEGLDPNDARARRLTVRHGGAPVRLEAYPFESWLNKFDQPLEVQLHRPVGVTLRLVDGGGIPLAHKPCFFEDDGGNEACFAAVTDAEGIAHFPALRDDDVAGRALIVDLGDGRKWQGMEPNALDPVREYRVDYRVLRGLVLSSPPSGCEVASIPLRREVPKLHDGYALGRPREATMIEWERRRALHIYRLLASLDWRSPEVDGSFQLDFGWQSARTAVVVREKSSRRPFYVVEVDDPTRIVASCPPTSHLSIELSNPLGVQGTLVVYGSGSIGDHALPPHDLNTDVRFDAPHSGLYEVVLAQDKYFVLWLGSGYSRLLAEVPLFDERASVSVSVSNTRSLSGTVAGTLSGGSERRTIFARDAAARSTVAETLTEANGGYVFPALPDTKLTLVTRWFMGELELGTVEPTRTTFSVQVPEAALRLSRTLLGDLADHAQIKVRCKLSHPEPHRRELLVDPGWDVETRDLIVVPDSYDVTIHCFGVEICSERVTLRDGDVHELITSRPPGALVQVRSSSPPTTQGVYIQVFPEGSNEQVRTAQTNNYVVPPRQILSAFLLEPGKYTVQVKGKLRAGSGKPSLDFDQRFEIEATSELTCTIDLRD